MKNLGTEFIASEEIKLTDNQYNASVLTPEANVYVDDEWTTYNKKLETDKKRKKPEENSPITWKRNVSPHSQESYLLEDRDFYQLDEGASAFNVYEQFINLDVLTELLVQQSTTYISTKTGGNFSPMPRK